MDFKTFMQQQKGGSTASYHVGGDTNGDGDEDFSVNIFGNDPVVIGFLNCQTPEEQQQFTKNLSLPQLINLMWKLGRKKGFFDS